MFDNGSRVDDRVLSNAGLGPEMRTTSDKRSHADRHSDSAMGVMCHKRNCGKAALNEPVENLLTLPVVSKRHDDGGLAHVQRCKLGVCNHRKSQHAFGRTRVSVYKQQFGDSA